MREVQIQLHKIGFTAKFSATNRYLSASESVSFFVVLILCRKHENVLLVNGKIRVARSAITKEVRVSGPVSRELHAVRKIVRSMLVQLT